MIKNQRFWQGTLQIKCGLGSIVPRLKSIGIFGKPRVYHRQRVSPRIAVRIGVHTEKAGQHHIKACFFTSFPDRGALGAFAVINESAGQCPPQRLVFSD